MFSYELSSKHAGLVLIGDYFTLSSLHSVLHDVYQRTPFLQEKESFLSLAYDIRKAYEGKRKIFQPPEYQSEIGIRYGEEMSWPVLLVQSIMLRVSLSSRDHTKKHQAITYALEDVIEDALKKDFANDANKIIDAWRRLNEQDVSLLDRLNELYEEFHSWNARQRKTQLPTLLLPSWIREQKL